MKRVTIFALANAAACSIAGAQEMIPLSQERGVINGGFLDRCAIDIDMAIFAKDFDPFEQTVLSEEECAETRASVFALATQNSTIDPRALSVLDHTEALLTQETHSTNLVVAGSLFEVTFELTEDSDFLISGRIEASANGSSMVYWEGDAQLYSFDTGNVLRLHFFGDGDQPGIDETFSHFGELSGGRYKLTTTSGSILDAPNELGESLATNSFDVRLRLLSACRADVNGDGSIDAEDFFAYLDLFAAGDPLADITGDGSIDAEDFFAYLDLFAAGCD